MLMFGRLGREVLGAAFCLCKYTSPRKLSSRLTYQRLHLRLRIGFAGCLDQSKYPLKPWYLHRSLCRNRCGRRRLLFIYSDLIPR